MLNLTARLAMSIPNLPIWDVNWDDRAPQKSRSSLGIDDFLPSISDGDALTRAAVQYTMEFLVERFDALHSLKSLVPTPQSPHPVKTTVVAPMPILFRDEKYKSETIEIIRQLMADAKLSGNSQVNLMVKGQEEGLPQNSGSRNQDIFSFFNYQGLSIKDISSFLSN